MNKKYQIPTILYINHKQNVNQKHRCCRKIQTIQLHFSEVQRHEKLDNILFRTASVCEKTVRKGTKER